MGKIPPLPPQPIPWPLALRELRRLYPPKHPSGSSPTPANPALTPTSDLQSDLLGPLSLLNPLNPLSPLSLYLASSPTTSPADCPPPTQPDSDPVWCESPSSAPSDSNSDSYSSSSDSSYSDTSSSSSSSDF